MRLSRNLVTALVANQVILAAVPAYAEGEPLLVPPPTVSHRFASTARAYVIEAAACSMLMGTVDGRPFDVRVGSRRCASTTPMPADAIPLTLRWEPRDDPQTVVLEANVPDAALTSGIQRAVTYAELALKGQIAAAVTPLRYVRMTPTATHGISAGTDHTGAIAFAIFLGVVTVVLGGIVALTSAHSGFSM